MIVSSQTRLVDSNGHAGVVVSGTGKGGEGWGEGNYEKRKSGRCSTVMCFVPVLVAHVVVYATVHVLDDTATVPGFIVLDFL